MAATEELKREGTSQVSRVVSNFIKARSVPYKGGTAESFAERWGDAAMTGFGTLIERMEEWIKESEAKDKFDAMSDSDKRAALAQANKEQE